MKSIFNSKIFSFFLIASLLLFLFQKIFQTYAFTDGYEFIWNSAEAGSLTTFIQQGRGFSGWIITSVFPQNIQLISDYSYLRAFNLCCLFVSLLLIYKILTRNSISNFHALIIVIVFMTAPYSSVIVHWEATSSCIWALPMALLSGELLFTALLNKSNINKKRFYIQFAFGIALGVISLFTYQPAFTAAIFPAFVHFITAQQRKIIWQYIAIYFSVFVLYFIIFQLQLTILNIPPNERAGIAVDSNKLIWFLKGAFIRSFQYSFIIGSYDIINAVRWLVILLIAFYIYRMYKVKAVENPFSYGLMILMFYILAYLPSFIATDTWISFRTMSAIAMLSSAFLIYSIIHLPVKKIISDAIVSVIAIACVFLAYNNCNVFTSIAIKEYNSVKEVISENLKQSYPDSFTVIMPEENFLVTQKIIKNVVTDEFGKLSNSVDWAAKTMPLQLIYELTGDRKKAEKIKVNYYYRNQLPPDSLLQKDIWLLDIEKIYLSNK